jgi:hypothetical protein
MAFGVLRVAGSGLIPILGQTASGVVGLSVLSDTVDVMPSWLPVCLTDISTKGCIHLDSRIPKQSKTKQKEKKKHIT